MDNGQWIIGKITNEDVAGEGEVFTVSKPFTVDHAIGPNGEIGMQMLPFVPGDVEASVDIFQDALSAVAVNIPDPVERRYYHLTTGISIAH